MTASIDEQLRRAQAALDKSAEQQEKLKKKVRALEKKQRDAAKKARDHRLIEVGAILEQATLMTFDSKESREKLSAVLNQTRHKDGRDYTLGESIARYFDESGDGTAQAAGPAPEPDTTEGENDLSEFTDVDPLTGQHFD